MSITHKSILYNGFMVTHNPTQFSDYLVAFPTKTDWRFRSDKSLIASSAQKLRIIADILDWREVLMTRPGCGMGGLEWDEVRHLLDCLDERFYVIERK